MILYETQALIEYHLYRTVRHETVHVISDPREPAVAIKNGSVLVYLYCIEFKMSKEWNFFAAYDHIFLDCEGRIVSRCSTTPRKDHFVELVE